MLCDKGESGDFNFEIEKGADNKRFLISILQRPRAFGRAQKIVQGQKCIHERCLYCFPNLPLNHFLAKSFAHLQAFPGTSKYQGILDPCYA